MKRFVVLTAACIAISGGAMAQETFGELYEKGAINLTNKFTLRGCFGPTECLTPASRS